MKHEHDTSEELDPLVHALRRAAQVEREPLGLQAAVLARLDEPEREARAWMRGRVWALAAGIAAALLIGAFLASRPAQGPTPELAGPVPKTAPRAPRRVLPRELVPETALRAELEGLGRDTRAAARFLIARARLGPATRGS
jgi:hypothetical protein